MRSGTGLTVTVVVTGAETRPAESVAVMVRVITEGVICVGGRVGATNVRVAPVPGGFGPCVTRSPTRAGEPL